MAAAAVSGLSASILRLTLAARGGKALANASGPFASLWAAQAAGASMPRRSPTTRSGASSGYSSGAPVRFTQTQ
jgi:hypothetical protein